MILKALGQFGHTVLSVDVKRRKHTQILTLQPSRLEKLPHVGEKYLPLDLAQFHRYRYARAAEPAPLSDGLRTWDSVLHGRGVDKQG